MHRPHLPAIRPQTIADALDSFLRFDVFGKTMIAVRNGDRWTLQLQGNEGKRSATGIVIPDGLPDAEVAQYLDDLFHESATLDHPSVRRLD